jgi:hypothetical protein
VLQVLAVPLRLQLLLYLTPECLPGLLEGPAALGDLTVVVCREVDVAGVLEEIIALPDLVLEVDNVLGELVPERVLL